MYLGYHEEGDKCPEKDCKGSLEYVRQKSCSCHISPPCSACVDAPLVCTECGGTPEEPEQKEAFITPDSTLRVYKPRPLDSSKIDYRIKGHTHFSMIKEGVYPEGTTMEEVIQEVNGTFGGRFEYFGNGKFKFIAYTD